MQLTTKAFFRKPSQIISRDILQDASLAMYYWTKYFKPHLTHGSVMKKWSSRARYFFQKMIRWCQNLLLLNYSYERSFAPATLIMLDYTLAHAWLYSWTRSVLSRATIFRSHHWRVRIKKKTKTCIIMKDEFWKSDFFRDIFSKYITKSFAAVYLH